jgi:hypothetical protein
VKRDAVMNHKSELTDTAQSSIISIHGRQLCPVQPWPSIFMPEDDIHATLTQRLANTHCRVRGLEVGWSNDHRTRNIIHAADDGFDVGRYPPAPRLTGDQPRMHAA